MDGFDSCATTMLCVTLLGVLPLGTADTAVAHSPSPDFDAQPLLKKALALTDREVRSVVFAPDLR